MPSEKDPIWFVLEDLKKDVDKIDTHLDVHITNTATLTTNVNALTRSVEELTRIITRDNGKPSILTQLITMNHQLGDLTKQLEGIKRHIGMTEADQKESKAERWKTIGKVVGLVSLAVPGILAFIDAMTR
ncbi:hypothetical protein HC928_00050 [bacterium]|nr:hypothetical protein [bacterium]